jgi:hypothetical protein
VLEVLNLSFLTEGGQQAAANVTKLMKSCWAEGNAVRATCNPSPQVSNRAGGVGRMTWLQLLLPLLLLLVGTTCSASVLPRQYVLLACEDDLALAGDVRTQAHTVTVLNGIN